MDKFAKALLHDYKEEKELEVLEKTAFDRHISNAATDLVEFGGKQLAKAKNPIAMGALGGALAGGTGMAATGRRGERKKRFVRGAVGGALGGAAGGVLLGGGLKNIGRYGEGIAEGAEEIRKGGIRDAQQGEFADLMKSKVYSKIQRRGGKAVSDAMADLELLDSQIKNIPKGTDKATVDALTKKYKDQVKAVNTAAGGWGGRFTAGETAAMTAGLVGAGAIGANKYQESKEASYNRVSDAIDQALTKEANVFASLAGRAMQGAGKAVANPGIAGAAVGAGVGAASAGEGNRLKGALVGGALGAGATKGLQALAPTTAKNVQQFGTALQREGGKAVTNAAREGATFTGALSKPMARLKNYRSNFASDNVRELSTLKNVGGKLQKSGTGVAVDGMKGSTAAAIGTAGAVGAGAAGGYAFSD